MSHYLDGALQITGGRYFWPLDPGHPGNEYDIDFIAHSLAAQTRWNGILSDRDGSPLHYSVAQHSVIVADLVNLYRERLVPDWEWSRRAQPSPALYGLLHDASEAYLADVPRPIKGLFEGYYDAEAKLMKRILKQFNVPKDDGIKAAVKRVDDMMIWLERNALAGQPLMPYSNEHTNPFGLVSIAEVVPYFYPWDAKTAKQRFLAKYEEIVQFQGNHTPVEYQISPDKGLDAWLPVAA